MRKFLLVGLLALTAACGAVAPPKTPAQALLEARASLGSAVAAFIITRWGSIIGRGMIASGRICSRTRCARRRRRSIRTGC